MIQAEKREERATATLNLPNYLLLLASISFVLFLLVTTAVVTGLFDRVDARLLDYFTNFQEQAPVWLTTISTWFQNSSSAGLGIISTMLILYWLVNGRIRRFFLLLASVGGAELLWFALMFIVGRERPEEVIIWGGLNLPSYPSGHALFNVAFYGALVYIFYPQIRSKKWRNVLLAIVGTLLLLTGLNRLFFSVHYFSDVIGGYLVGAAWVSFALWLVEWGLTKRKQSG